jgi:hypothetical protein
LEPKADERKQAAQDKLEQQKQAAQDKRMANAISLMGVKDAEGSLKYPTLKDALAALDEATQPEAPDGEAAMPPATGAAGLPSADDVGHLPPLPGAAGGEVGAGTVLRLPDDGAAAPAAPGAAPPAAAGGAAPGAAAEIPGIPRLSAGTSADSMYNELPPGAYFLDPEGKLRQKPRK